MTHKNIGTICIAWILILYGLHGLYGCSNTPYPGSDKTSEVIYYSSFDEPPKDLDPQTSYTVSDTVYLSLCYETLLEYDYLKRPIQLTTGLALEVPKPQLKRDETGKTVEVRYHFEIQPGVFFQDDPCFEAGKRRELKASDFEFAFKRVTDPQTNCPVAESFSHLKGFQDFRNRLEAARQKNPKLRISELYREAGAFDGFDLKGDYSFDLVLENPYPQILYWLAMRFISALPPEAVEYYDGKKHDGENRERPTFREHPVGTGPYRFDWKKFDRQARIIMVKNDHWWGKLYPQRKAPGVVFPIEPGEAEDVKNGIFEPAIAGKPLPFIDRIEWYLEREHLSYFNKFLQGYYDSSSVPIESFNQVIKGDRLTPEMQAKGIRLVKDTGLDIFYIGFNLDDDMVGAPLKFHHPNLEKERAKNLERNRKLRQAMSLAIDSKEFLRIFFNGLGIPAQSPLPPGIFGYDPSYKNPYCQYDPELKLARRLLREAGYENGLDPSTGKPLVLTFDTGDTSTEARVRYNFFIDAWRKLGLDVKLEATDYNQFQTKMQDGNYQIFLWGWLADYPDPENFLFLLYGPNSSKHEGRKPNSARFENADYDLLFKQMETRENDETRYEISRKLVKIFEAECPWIPLMHSEVYILYHSWYTKVKPHPVAFGLLKYHTIDTEKRSYFRKKWNRPILWPAAVIVVGMVAISIPAIRVFLRERR
jgi:ABC-type transport system substrate-binding protein